MSKQKDPGRLSLLLGDIDPALLEEAYMTDSPEKLAKLRMHAHPRPRRVITMPRLAVAMISFVLALSMMLSVFVLLRPETPGVESPTGTHGTADPDDPYVDPATIDAPWKTGKLTLTSLTYKPATDALSTGRLSFDKLTSVETDAATDAVTDAVTDAITDAVTDAVTDAETQPPDTPDAPVFGTGENVQVSIMDNTKISDYMGPDLIKTRPTDGEHMGCTDVYYNIHTDEIVCMSCNVLALVQGTELYTYAAMDAFMEEILLDEVNLWASGEVNVWRETYRKMLDTDKTRELFSELKKPTLAKLGVDDFAFDSHEVYVKEHIGDYKYPVVDIVEYGADPDKCLFSLVSPLTGIAYGSYVMDLTTGEARRIDGKIVGDDDDTYTAHLALNQAKGVTVLEDYQKIVVTLPYIAFTVYRVDDHNMAPEYTGDNVIVFDVATGTGQVLVPIDGEQTPKLPATAAQVYGNVVYYKTLGGDWCFYVESADTLYTVKGEFSRVITSGKGVSYAVMKQADGYQFFELTGKNGAFVPAEAEESYFDLANRFVMEGHLRVDVLTLETTPLWEGTPTVTAVSKDGRFMYLYFEGADHILCIDVCKAESGVLNLSDTFVTQAAEAAASGTVTYGLFLNAAEDALLMTYCKKGLVVFDREAYMDHVRAGNDYEAPLDYYTVNGRPLTFINRQNAEILLTLLSIIDRIDLEEDVQLHGYNKNYSLRLRTAEQAERMIEYMDVWATNAEIPTALLSRMLGDISISEFLNRYRFVQNQLNDEFESYELSTKYGHDEEKRLDGFSRDHAKAIFAFFGVDYTDEQLAEMKSLFRSVLDPVIKKCSITPYDEAVALASVMDEAALIATGVTYDEFMKMGAWLTKPNGNDHFHATTNAAGGDVRFSLYKWVDHEYLRGFMEKLHFVEGEKEITSIARIYHEFGIPYGYPRCDVCVLWVGYDADGRAYACIDGYYAEITPEEAEAFKAVFVGAHRRNDPYVCYH